MSAEKKRGNPNVSSPDISERPKSLWCPEIEDELKGYLFDDQDDPNSRHWKNSEHDRPSILYFAKYLIEKAGREGKTKPLVAHRTLKDWAANKEHPAYDYLQCIKTIGEAHLLDDALASKVNPMIAKMALSSYYGVDEKSVTESKIQVKKGFDDWYASES